MAARYDFEFSQGETVVLSLQDESSDTPSWSGATLRGQMRSAPESTTKIADFSGTITSGSSKTGTLTLSAATTAAIDVDDSGDCDFDKTCYVYDAEIEYADGTVTKLLYGIVNIIPEVTR